MDAAPHPLVVRLVQQLLKRRLKAFDDSTRQAVADKLIAQPAANVQNAIAAAGALQAAQIQALDAGINAVLRKKPDQLSADEQRRLVQAAEHADIPDLVTIAGYLGGTVDVRLSGRNAKWWILYLDSQLQNWRLIADDDVLFHQSLHDDNAPFRKRDVIWVDGDAFTATGEAPPRPEVQARFLRGDFARAGDLVAPAPGGAPSPSTGVFCEVTTPSCCTKTVRH
jgi:hypothetical protein